MANATLELYLCIRVKAVEERMNELKMQMRA